MVGDKNMNDKKVFAVRGMTCVNCSNTLHR
jgi:hypothetical protein